MNKWKVSLYRVFDVTDSFEIAGSLGTCFDFEQWQVKFRKLSSKFASLKFNISLQYYVNVVIWCAVLQFYEEKQITTEFSLQ